MAAVQAYTPVLMMGHLCCGQVWPAYPCGVMHVKRAQWCPARFALSWAGSPPAFERCRPSWQAKETLWGPHTIAGVVERQLSHLLTLPSNRRPGWSGCLASIGDADRFGLDWALWISKAQQVSTARGTVRKAAWMVADHLAVKCTLRLQIASGLLGTLLAPLSLLSTLRLPTKVQTTKIQNLSALSRLTTPTHPR